MAQFKDKYQFSIVGGNEDLQSYTVRFSITISDFYVVEHSIAITVFKDFMGQWNRQSFKSECNVLSVKLKSDGYTQIAVLDNNTRHLYSLSPSDFSRWFTYLKQVVEIIDVSDVSGE